MVILKSKLSCNHDKIEENLSIVDENKKESYPIGKIITNKKVIIVEDYLSYESNLYSSDERTRLFNDFTQIMIDYNDLRTMENCIKYLGVCTLSKKELDLFNSKINSDSKHLILDADFIIGLIDEENKYYLTCLSLYNKLDALNNVESYIKIKSI